MPAVFLSALRVAASRGRCQYYLHKNKNRHNLESLRGKGAAVAAVVTEIQPVPRMDFQIQGESITGTKTVKNLKGKKIPYFFPFAYASQRRSYLAVFMPVFM